MLYFSKCEYCQKLFRTDEGLKSHQSRITVSNYKCHRLRILNEKVSAKQQVQERKQHIESTKLNEYHADVSEGRHPQGVIITAKEKKLVLNLYQSYRNDGKSVKESREETARRLGFGSQSVRDIVREKLSEGTVQDNLKNRSNRNAFEKLAEEEVDELRKIIHTEFKNCRVKRMTPENEEFRYPTLASVHEVVLQTHGFPNWSLTTF